ncbi:MAG: phenylalanine--tRNA ligase subunit alpha [Polyangiaceae bacterium]|nr:phenylalanine--tRNA ligase subunit alpha [Polyangiaceae bacterium]MCW5792572.1 phenylalanine--tRNA ligase subunit alpha [Polyangiaceae bacterium]
MDPTAEIEQGLSAFGEDFRAQFAAAESELTLRSARAELLGKKGRLTQLLKLMGRVPADQRKRLGEAVNASKLEVEACFQARLDELSRAAREADLKATPFDLSLPGRAPARGHLHPLTQVREQVLDTFEGLGFEVASGPQVELEENNFTKLAFPPDHPATDMQDTFWVKVAGAESARTLLRTHTSNVQVREMSQRQPPMAVVSGGAVFRRDDDVTHSPMFHQIEGFWVGEGVSFSHLKGVLTAFLERMYGAGVAVRFRPSYFPFVEPGAEVDVACDFCTETTCASCRVCKGTRWLEILGCGMIHPEVLEHCGIDSERYTGFAFGLGVERVAMRRYGIPDIRLLFENDPRFLAQF